MSAPTKIYLALVSAIALVWAVQTHLVGAAELEYRGDAHYMLQNAHRLPAVLRGRVVLRDPSGGALAVPEDTLTVAVSAHDLTGTVAVARAAVVDTDGLFEVIGLPEGEASVVVRLGGGSVVWKADHVAVGVGLWDERLDPIDLGDRLFPIRLAVVDPEGEHAANGHLVWRLAGDGASDDLSFTGDAPIREGLATFLATAPSVDVVTLVPGASCELFEGVWDEEEVHLAPGVTALLHPTGQIPSGDEWTFRLALAPVRLEPGIEYDADSLTDRGSLVALLENGESRIRLARGGRYSIEWWAVPAKGRRARTIRITPRESTVDVPSGAGEHPIDVPFPLEEFARRTASPR